MGLYFLMFVGMSVISILGILLLFLLKGEGTKKAAFYFVVVWGMIIAALSATSLPSNYIGKQLVAWGFGILGIVALLIRIRTKDQKLCLTAHILAAVSVAAGMLNFFLI